MLQNSVRHFTKVSESFRTVSDMFQTRFGNDSRSFRASSENLPKHSNKFTQTFAEQSQASISHAAYSSQIATPLHTGTICTIELNNNLKASAAAG
jgi:hypothetical protein